MRLRPLLPAALLSLASAPSFAANDSAPDRVDLRLVIAVDVGGSEDINQTVQRQGYVAAFRSPDVFAAIGETCKPLVRDTGALVQPIGAGVAETAVVHIPAVPARAARQRRIPDKRIETAHGQVMVN